MLARGLVARSGLGSPLGSSLMFFSNEFGLDSSLMSSSLMGLARLAFFFFFFSSRFFFGILVFIRVINRVLDT